MIRNRFKAQFTFLKKNEIEVVGWNILNNSENSRNNPRLIRYILNQYFSQLKGKIKKVEVREGTLQFDGDSFEWLTVHFYDVNNKQLDVAMF